MGDGPYNKAAPVPSPKPTVVPVDLVRTVQQMQKEMQQMQSEQKVLRDKNNQLSTDLQSLQESNNEVKNENSKLKEQVTNLNQKLAEFKLYLGTFQKQDHRMILEAQETLRQNQVSLKAEINDIKTEQRTDQTDVKTPHMQQDDTVGMTSQLQDLKTEFHSLQSIFIQFDGDHTRVRQEVEKLQTDYKQLETGQNKIVEMFNKLQMDQVESLRKETEKDQKTFQSDGKMQMGCTDTVPAEAHQLLHSQDTMLKTEIEGVMASLQHRHDSLKSEIDMIKASLQDNQDLVKSEIDGIKTSLQHSQDSTLKSEKEGNMTSLQHIQGTLIKSETDVVKASLQDNRHLSFKSDIEGIIASLLHGHDLLQSEITTIKTSHEDSQRKATSVIAKLETRLGKGRRLFYACGLNKDTTQQHGAMIFRRVGINEGGFYNSDNGVFTARRGGLYCFAATVASLKPGVTVCCHIMTGDAQCCAVQGDHQGQTGTWVVWLSAGQRMWVQAASAVKGYRDEGDTFFPSCDFSGVLLLLSP
ncbi:uncharacterized protein LOC143293445 [Babylonia areolata]|uniref:uncharacterized protein LOC143293445 n=1 Tax=Babylonia areolata TaxID=304850 RepID=UPI003FCF1772